MSHKLRSLAIATGATAAIAAAAPAAASAATPVGTSVTPITTGGWTVCAWFFQWKSCAEVKYVNGGWTVGAAAGGNTVGASAGANYTTNPLQAAANAAANAGAQAVAAAAGTNPPSASATGPGGTVTVP